MLVLGLVIAGLTSCSDDRTGAANGCTPVSVPSTGDCAFVDWDYVSDTGKTVSIRAYLNSPGCAENVDHIDVSESDTNVRLTAIAKYTAGVGASCPTALGSTQRSASLDAPLGERVLTGCRPTHSFAPSGGYNNPAPRSNVVDCRAPR